MTKKTIAFVTLGCKLNFAETSTIAHNFLEKGYTRVSASQKADIYIVNTCTVTAESDKKCRQAIRKLAHQHPAAKIIVTGCYAKLKAEEVRALAPNVLVGDKAEVLQAAELSPVKPMPFSMDIDFFPAFSSGDRTRSFLKIQDGCDYHCSYCTVPLARGRSRNMAIADVEATARTIAAKGVREIALTGVNIGDFGKTGGEHFFDLLKRLVQIEGIARYRISSIEPNLLTNEMIDWIAAADKVLPHFHIPLQSGSNKILKLMRRRYSSELVAQQVAHIRKAMPQAFIGLDVIVGFPGETTDDFEESYRFLTQLQPAFLHIFPYSPRPNTPAAAFDKQVPEQEKKRRAKIVNELCRKLHRRFYEQHIGIKEEVLVENTRKHDCLFGYTRNYIKTEIPYDKNIAGKIVVVKTVAVAESGNMLCDVLEIL